jgi:hypothetical protein
VYALVGGVGVRVSRWVGVRVGTRVCVRVGRWVGVRVGRGVDVRVSRWVVGVYALVGGG